MTGDGAHGADGRLALGQGAGLVPHDPPHQPGGLERLAGAHDNPTVGGHPVPRTMASGAAMSTAQG